MSNSKSKMTAVLGIFTALTVLLQLLSYFVKIGTFSITLTLIPIVLAGVMYGPVYSTVLGAAFGIITYIGAFSGIDPGGEILFNASPWRLIILCLGKAMLCGFISGIVGHSLKEKNLLLAVVSAAILAPVVNTGMFIFFMFAFFKGDLYDWAGGTDIVTYIIVGLTGINFLIELGVNAVLSPVILRVLKALKRFK